MNEGIGEWNLTEQAPEYFEAIIEASTQNKVPIKDLTLDQFTAYVDQNPSERRVALQVSKATEIEVSEWERVKEISAIIDSASKQMAEKNRFRIAPEQPVENDWNWSNIQPITVKSRKRVIELTLLTSLLSVILFVAGFFCITLLNPSISFENGIVPVVAIPGFLGPVVSYIIFTQSYLLSKAIAEAEDLKRTDPLTGLYNIHFFTELANMELSVASRYDFPSSLLLIDLDHFRNVNDVFGHMAGDEVIKILSNVIKNNLRRTDFVGRLSGEEWVVFLPHTKLEGAMVAANRICRLIAETEITYNDERIHITACVGVGSTANGVDNFDQLIQIADSAISVAKVKGSDQVEGCLPVVHSAETKTKTINILSK